MCGDADGKGPKTDSEDFALLRFREIEFRTPLSDDLGSNNEAEGGGNEGNEAPPKQFHIWF